MPQVSDSGELNKNSHIALIHVAFPIVLQGRHSRTVISELNTAPMHTLTNASPRHHWSSTHSSGPERIAWDRITARAALGEEFPTRILSVYTTGS